MSKIAIIGAGPAGTSAGYHLATKGHHVTLIDKQSFPRDKVCGDGISPLSLKALSLMNIEAEYLQKLASEHYLAKGLYLNYFGIETDFVIPDLFGLCIPRAIFDYILYQRAIEVGCIPHQQAINNIQKFSSDFKQDFDYIIDARGILAGECNAIGIREYWSIPVASFLEKYHHRIQLYMAQSLTSKGYFWIFPIGIDNDLLKLNVGIYLSMDVYKKQGKNLISLFEDFIAKNDLIREIFANVQSRNQRKVQPLATTKWQNNVCENNILKIGDAANSTDLPTGEGISNALYSGFYAACAIDTNMDKTEVKLKYENLYQQHIQKPLVRRRLQYSVITYPPVNQVILWVLKNNKIFPKFGPKMAGFGSIPHLD